MSSLNCECVYAIEPSELPFGDEHIVDAYLEAARILLILLDNVLKDPVEAKYRKLRLENKTIKDKLLTLSGVRDLLLAIGFKYRTPDEFILPVDVPLQHIRQYRNLLNERRQYWLSLMHNASHEIRNNQLRTSEPEPDRLPTIDKAQSFEENSTADIETCLPYKQRITFPLALVGLFLIATNLLNIHLMYCFECNEFLASLQRTSNKFLLSLELFSDSVMQYEDEKLLACGRQLIPIDELTQNASEKLFNIQEHNRRIEVNSKQQQNPTDDTGTENFIKEPCIRDLILVELVNWFNTKFFEWVNKLPCSVCGSEDSKLYRTQAEGDVRVEVSICCGQETKFYRYNDIKDLLRTRRGRCGEYANCFTFLCRCLDYDARIVHSLFDHVWTEVYSESQLRWLHVDPSENVVDSPLMYQCGWKRNIDYIFAYSCDDIQDVTWRYSTEHKETLKKRRLCDEKAIIEAILTIRRKRQNSLSEQRKKTLSQRCMLELIELNTERQPTENELKGRTSGSLAWRQSRGESTFSDIYVFTLNETEISEKQFNLRYCCSSDVYERYLTAKKTGFDDDNHVRVIETYKTWQSCQYSSTNILRKVEQDWRMVYLARQPDTDYAELKWRFDFSSTDLKIKSYKLHFERKTFGEGKIEVLLQPLDNRRELDQQQDQEQELGELTDTSSDQFSNCKSFDICVRLSGGKGDVAWQHTQLFRQSVNSKNYTFDLQIELT